MATGMTHWRPFAEMEDLRKRMDRMFEDMGNGRAREWNSADEVEATCHDGVLEVSIPKPEHEERKAVTITPKAD